MGKEDRAEAAGDAEAPAAVPPQNLTAVLLPTVTGPITGPGMPYESVQSLAPGKGLANFKYEAKEYFISGTANGQPYKTRIVVRKPSSNSKFSGMVLVEPMHPSGSAHMFEMTSIYTMTSGHAAVDISAGGLQQVIDANPERYKGFQVGNAQISEIIAQVGALVKSKDPNSPFAGLDREKDGAGRNVGNRRHADRVSAFPHGVQNAGHAADLRRLHADVQRFGDPSDRCADDPRPDDARSVQRQHYNAAGWRCARRPIPCV